MFSLQLFYILIQILPQFAHSNKSASNPVLEQTGDKPLLELTVMQFTREGIPSIDTD